MKKIIMGIIAIMIIIMLVAVGFVYTGGTEYFEDKFGDNSLGGSLGQEIILEYEDGSFQAIKPIMDSSILSVWSGSKKVNGIWYKLNSKASGTGYTDVTLDFSKYDVTVNVKSGTSTVKSKLYDDRITRGSVQTRTIPLDDNWYKIGETFMPCSSAAGTGGWIGGVSPGKYTVELVPSGSLSYTPSGEEWVEFAVLPSSISFTVEVKADKTLTVSFSQGYELY